jgi:GH15 family glucan-1,4-alpha-glucosidase
MRIEDYAFIGDTHSGALISLTGSVDWLCLPRFDSAACFAAILDHELGGHWRIAPESGDFTVERRYRDKSFVLETTFHTSTGSVVLTDCLPVTEGDSKDPRTLLTSEVLLRQVQAVDGSVPMTMEWSPRFDYGHVTPWIRRIDTGFDAVGGPDALDLQATVPMTSDKHVVNASFEVSADDVAMFMMRYHESHLAHSSLSVEEDCGRLIEECDAFWQEWAGRCTVKGRWAEEVLRSLMILKAMTFSPTGGIVAAPTASLPETLGGERNWDYRFCWLRDTTFSLEVLIEHGYTNEAAEWRDWLLRAVAGDPEELQIMYGVQGERRLTEVQLDWLSGYEGSKPVRVGNAASEQFQLDVYGELLDAMYSSVRAGLDPEPQAWEVVQDIVDFVCRHWMEPDEGIWEVRSGRKHFVHSKVMAWVAVDRAIKMIEEFGRKGPEEYWRSVRSEIREEVMLRGYNRKRGHFIRAYDDDSLDASLLLLPIVGFINAQDPRMVSTIEAIERGLLKNGLLYRYQTDAAKDGLSGDEGAFIMCSFWLVDCLLLIDRRDRALELFERLVALQNDLGLLSEEYDSHRRRLVGNFPQAFSHVALATSAVGLERGGETPGLQRGRGSPIQRLSTSDG